MTPRKTEEQIQDLVDGKLDDTARNALLARLKTDPALLELYCSYAELESAFRRMRTSRFALGEGIAEIHGGAARRMQRRTFAIALASAAAVLALLGAILGGIFVVNPPPVLTLRTSPGSLIDVAHSPDAKNQPAPGTLAAGSSAVLSQGTVELQFRSGVRAIVQGPADFTLHEKNELHLRQGTAWFEVPPKAVGFRAQTPGLTVTDLGTEFGVRTRPYGLDEVHVFRGKVEARSRRTLKAVETLTTGMARVVNVVGRLDEIEPDPSHFLKSLPDSLPHLHWSFDDGLQSTTAAGNLPAADSETGRFAGLDDTKAFQTTAGRFGKAIATTGAFAEARSGWTGVEGSAPRTIAHWIKLGPDVSDDVAAHVLVGWGSHTLTPFNPNPAFLTYLRRINGHTMVGVSFGASCFDGRTPLEVGKWHHFTVVCSGRLLADGTPEIRCYLDGRPEPMTPYIPKSLLPPDFPEALSVRTDSSGSDSIPLSLFPRNWCGDQRTRNLPLAIDELYVFEAALEEDAVKTLYQHNQPGPGKATNLSQPPSPAP
jgi:ferric-dicitrate binding protein FerR (iron transport regulator)